MTTRMMISIGVVVAVVLAVLPSSCSAMVLTVNQHPIGNSRQGGLTSSRLWVGGASAETAAALEEGSHSGKTAATTTEKTSSRPHFVIEALGDTTPDDYCQFLNSRSGNPQDYVEDEHTPTYREISNLCRSIFLKGHDEGGKGEG